MEKRKVHWINLTGSLLLVLAFRVTGGNTGSDVTTESTQTDSSLYYVSNLAYLAASQGSTVKLPNSLNMQRHIAFSFRTCHAGSLFRQSGASADSWLRLQINSDGLLTLSWSVNSNSQVLSDSLIVGSSPSEVVTDNHWYTVDMNFLTGEIYLRLEKGGSVLHSTLVSSSTYNTYLQSLDLTGGAPITLGDGYTGCFHGGPSLLMHAAEFTNVTQGTCPLDGTVGCGDDPCSLSPCNNGGRCTRGEASYTCTCVPPYAGVHCQTDQGHNDQGDCTQTPCQNLGVCVPAVIGMRQYECQCPSGYTGVNCEIELDECAVQPCQNGGQCSDQIGGYSCHCAGTGYQGTHCEDNIDECLTNAPCVQGTCSDLPGSYKCQCSIGFAGKNCDQPINECISSPCQNGGQCNDLLGYFSCTCVPGYTGQICHVEIDDCSGVVCEDANAQCRDLLNAHECICNPGYEADATGICTAVIDCQSAGCQNGGQCSLIDTQYVCVCTAAYTGEFCSTERNGCDPDPCLNSATCVNLGAGGYRCDCAPGYLGDHCEIDLNECGSGPCPQVATCEDLVNGYVCRCPEGFNFTGVDCKRDVDYCELAPCENGGTCQPGPEGGNSYRCQCASDWMGRNCSQEYNACAFSPCENGATCSTTSPSHNYVCTCVEGFTDRHCATNTDDCVGVTCPPPTSCVDGVNNYTCSCPVGFAGNDCLVAANDCAQAPCLNGGTCEPTETSYTCVCPGEWVNHTQYTEDPTSVYRVGFEGDQCQVDIQECTMPICLNGGICQQENDTDYGFKCYCPNGGEYYAGKYCHIEKDYCTILADPPACRNGGTCLAEKDSFECECAPGFTGPRCDMNIDECLSTPCINGATCIDGGDQYTCVCLPGFTGNICESDADECVSNPCQHGGACVDQLNGYVCNCTDTGFYGVNCEYQTNECLPDPCYNGAVCSDAIKGYTCTCWPGFTGPNCEVDINECASAPCLNNGTCSQRSDPSRPDFDVRYADGYECDCQTGFSGDNCEVNIDECKSGHTCVYGNCIDAINGYVCACNAGYMGLSCDVEINECSVFDPCQFGAACVDHIAHYECQCGEYEGAFYGGKNCSVQLLGCEMNSCQNGATCVPILAAELPSAQHSSYCDCLPGQHGDLCEQNTTASFFGSSFLKYAGTDGQADLDVSFRFQTTLPNGLLVLNAKSNDESSHNYFMLQMVEGVTVRLDYHSTVYDKELEVTVPDASLVDGQWYQVNLTIRDTSLTLDVYHPACPDGRCSDVTTQEGPQIQHHTLGETVFGGDQVGYPFVENIPDLTACVQDITIDGDIIIPGEIEAPDVSENVGLGCARTDQCGPDPCLSHGHCTDLWFQYTCTCWRPYFGENCAEEYTAGTFGSGDMSSVAIFSLPEDNKHRNELKNRNFISFFFRSRQETGLMFYLGNRDDTYIAFVLNSGYLRIHVRFSPTEQICDQSESYVTNGEQYYFHFEREFDNIKYWINWVDGRNDPTLTEESTAFNCRVLAYNSALQPEYLYIGGMAPAPGSRRKRQTNILDMEPFKGTMQDAQQNGMLLQLFPNSTMNMTGHPESYPAPTLENVLEGEVTDLMCLLHAPCVNNATCTDKFFNNYECLCVEGFRGKNCSELDFCVSSYCPGNATCNNLDDGYECVSAATFNGVSSHIQYYNSLNHSSAINTLSAEFRTRQTSGTVLHIRGEASHEDNFFTVDISNGRLLLTFDLGSATRQLNSSDSEGDLSDGDWHNVTVEIQNGGIMCTVDTGSPSGISVNVSVTLFELVKETEDVYVGGVPEQYRADHPTMIQSVEPFKGCMEEIRIGELILPYFNPEDLENNTSVEQFYADSIRDVDIGCIGDPVCDTNECENNATCHNIWNAYECLCIAGFNGSLCESNIDECVGHLCENNATCVDGIAEYTCDCALGYSGERCEIDVDECESSPCVNNGTCLDLIGRYECNCTANYTGVDCQIDIRENCEVNPDLCNNGTCVSINTTFEDVTTFNCSCFPGVTGRYCDTEIDYCEADPCYNNATCVSSTKLLNYTCQCVLGYTGRDCETEIDECDPSPCQNEATCVDHIGYYECQCAKGWNGMDCELDINECDIRGDNITEPCDNGRCENKPGSYVCNCTGSGYEGPRCENDIDECLDATTCKNGANCTNLDGDFSCNCTLGYEAKDCGIANCSHGQCLNGGVCEIEGDRRWFCDCPQYIEGERCEAPGPCLDEPCKNNATCDQTGELYECTCQSGWEGVNCTADIDECVRHAPCLNGATCTNTDGSYSCQCARGFTDDNCTTDIDECESDPCQHSGRCNDQIDGYMCNCTETGYNGTHCEADVDECLLFEPCENGGTCDNLEGSYNCTCSPEYIGDTCHSANPCNEEYCYNGGSCDYVLDDPYRNATAVCQCADPWYGAQCEFTDSGANIGLIVGLTVGLVLAALIVALIVVLVVFKDKRATRGTYSPSRQETVGSRVELGNVLKQPPLERLI